jgi:hypothetical protein
LIAADASALASIAVGVANGSRARISAQIVDERGLLFDRHEPVRSLEQHLLRVTGWES